MSDVHLPPLTISPQALRQMAALRILDVPDNLRQLSSPVKLDGQVISRAPDQSVILRTNEGDIKLRDQGSPKLQVGDKLSVELSAGAPPRQAVLRAFQPAANASVQQPPHLNVAQPVTTTTQPSANNTPLPVSSSGLVLDDAITASTTTPRIVTADLQAGQTVRLSAIPVTALSNVPAITTNLSLPPQAITTPLLLQVLSSSTNGLAINAPQARNIPPLLVILPNGTVLSAPSGMAAPVKLPAQLPGQPTLPPMPGGSVTTTTSIISPASTAAQDLKVMQLGNILSGNHFSAQEPPALFSTNSASGGQLGQVIGFTARQQPVIRLLQAHLPVGAQSGNPSYILHYPSQNVQVGQVLQLSNAIGHALSPDDLQAMALAKTASWWLPGQWDDFTQIMLQAPAALGEMLSAQLPKAGGTQTGGFTGTAALLLSLMQGSGDEAMAFLAGDGDGLAALNSKAMAARWQGIASDLQQAAGQSVQDMQGQNWRLFPLPIMVSQAQIDKVALYIPADQNEPKRKQRSPNSAIRFVLSARLSRMGDLQLEGLFQPEKKLLDVQVRSEHPFSAEARSHIGDIYRRALNRGDLTGEVFFQLKQTAWCEFTGIVTGAGYSNVTA